MNCLGNGMLGAERGGWVLQGTFISTAALLMTKGL